MVWESICVDGMVAQVVKSTAAGTSAFWAYNLAVQCNGFVIFFNFQ
jgi:hypothetical protein